jgi:uncharacterized protein
MTKSESCACNGSRILPRQVSRFYLATPRAFTYTKRGMDWPSLMLAAFAVLFIGVAKAGFGGGLGMLVTPLCVLVFGPKLAIGIVLPLLCAGDVFSMYHYWRKWRADNLKYLLPGVVVGVIIGVQLIGRFSPRQLNVVIAVIALLFVVFQLVKDLVFRAEGAFAPNHAVGLPSGVAMGITSTFAHGAGPVAAMFLVPQRLSKEVFVGTNILLFTWVNWIKLPFFWVDRSMVNLPLFAPEPLITAETLWWSARFFPLVPLGVWIGVWLNRRFSEQAFVWIIHATLLLTGLQLVFNFDLARWFR